MANSVMPILLIEDNPGDARLVREMLAEANAAQASPDTFELKHVTHLAHAEALLAHTTFAAILLDLSLPDCAGLETLRQVCRAAPDMPVIVTSGQGDEALAVDAVQAGAQDYLVKSHLDSHWLARAIRYAIERMRANQLIARQNSRRAALRAIDSAITSSFDLRVTLDIFLENVVSELRVDTVNIWLLNHTLHVLEYTAGRGMRAEMLRQGTLRLDAGFASQAVVERRVIHISDLLQVTDTSPYLVTFQMQNFRDYYAVPFIAKGHVLGVLEILHRAPLTPDPEWLDYVQALAGQAAIAIDNASLLNDLQRSNLELSLAYDATIEGWSRALDLRDKETEGHTQRVTETTVQLARLMGIDDLELVQVRRGALLHDIGKMGIPDHILHKPGALTVAEWEVMRQHPRLALELLSPIAYLRPACDIPYCHHEKWDGTGYPRQLKAEQIPLTARIFAIVDVWDALRSNRPYRAAWDDTQVKAFLQAQAGKHFEPQVVAAFLTFLENNLL